MTLASTKHSQCSELHDDGIDDNNDNDYTTVTMMMTMMVMLLLLMMMVVVMLMRIGLRVHTFVSALAAAPSLSPFSTSNRRPSSRTASRCKSQVQRCGVISTS